MTCELCKYEYKGTVKWMPILNILKTLKKSQTFYCTAINIPVIVYIIIRLRFLFRILIKQIRRRMTLMKLQDKFSGRLWDLAKIYALIIMRLIPISVLGVSLPIIVFTTYVLSKSLIAECREFEIKNYNQ